MEALLSVNTFKNKARVSGRFFDVPGHTWLLRPGPELQRKGGGLEGLRHMWCGAGRSYAIIMLGSQRMSCGKMVQSTSPMMIQMTNGQTPLMMSAIVIPRLASADPLR